MPCKTKGSLHWLFLRPLKYEKIKKCSIQRGISKIPQNHKNSQKSLGGMLWIEFYSWSYFQTAMSQPCVNFRVIFCNRRLKATYWGTCLPYWGEIQATGKTLLLTGAAGRNLCRKALYITNQNSAMAETKWQQQKERGFFMWGQVMHCFINPNNWQLINVLCCL